MFKHIPKKSHFREAAAEHFPRLVTAFAILFLYACTFTLQAESSTIETVGIYRTASGTSN